MKSWNTVIKSISKEERDTLLLIMNSEGIEDRRLMLEVIINSPNRNEIFKFLYSSWYFKKYKVKTYTRKCQLWKKWENGTFKDLGNNEWVELTLKTKISQYPKVMYK